MKGGRMNDVDKTSRGYHSDTAIPILKAADAKLADQETITAVCAAITALTPTAEEAAANLAAAARLMREADRG